MWHKKALPFYGNAFLYLLGRHGAKRRPRPADGAGTHDAQAGSGIDDRKARPPPPRAGRRTRLLCGHGICDAGWRHEVHCDGERRPFCKKAWRKTFRLRCGGDVCCKATKKTPEQNISRAPKARRVSVQSVVICAPCVAKARAARGGRGRRTEQAHTTHRPAPA